MTRIFLLNSCLESEYHMGRYAPLQAIDLDLHELEGVKPNRKYLHLPYASTTSILLVHTIRVL